VIVPLPGPLVPTLSLERLRSIATSADGVSEANFPASCTAPAVNALHSQFLACARGRGWEATLTAVTATLTAVTASQDATLTAVTATLTAVTAPATQDCSAPLEGRCFAGKEGALQEGKVLRRGALSECFSLTHSLLRCYSWVLRSDSWYCEGRKVTYYCWKSETVPLPMEACKARVANLGRGFLRNNN